MSYAADALWTPEVYGTSAEGAMSSVMPVVYLLGSLLLGQGTATGGVPASFDNKAVIPSLSTTTGPAEQRERSTNKVVLELRRLSGLTWEELAIALEVSRRTLHHWASGKPISATNEQHLLRLLALVKHIDRGTAKRNRELLLSPAPDNRLLLDLLSNGQFDDIAAIAGRGIGRSAGAWPSPSSSVLKERRPPHPVDLIGSVEDAEPMSNGPYVPSLSRGIKVG
jgi:DNA-binding transcriptional regulator YiaG